jgi:hypothetical protein
MACLARRGEASCIKDSKRALGIHTCQQNCPS